MEMSSYHFKDSVWAFTPLIPTKSKKAKNTFFMIIVLVKIKKLTPLCKNHTL
jgi:hypothetical protein